MSDRDDMVLALGEHLLTGIERVAADGADDATADAFRISWLIEQTTRVDRALRTVERVMRVDTEEAARRMAQVAEYVISASEGGTTLKAAVDAAIAAGSRPALEVVPLGEVETGEAAPLLLGRLDPEDHTILFGDGGVGKGIVTAWWIARLSRQGHRVLVLDYERHARYEWRPRVEAFGGDLERVFIAQPSRAIWDVAGAIAQAADELDVTYLVVDSVGYACLGQEVEKSATATRYSLAIATIGRPALSLAHTTKADADPKHPFGSVFWSNGARVTIGMAGSGDQPRVLANKKTNQRAPFAAVEVDWSWIGTGLPATLVERPAKSPTVAGRAFEALGQDLLTAEELLTRVNGDGFEEKTLGVLRNELSKAKGRSFRRLSDGRWGRLIRIAEGGVRDGSDE